MCRFRNHPPQSQRSLSKKRNKAHLSNPLLHNTLGGVHAVAELHFMHPQFVRPTRCVTSKNQIQNTLQSNSDPIHCIQFVEHRNPTHILCTQYTLNAVTVQSCRAKRRSDATRDNTSTHHDVTAELRPGAAAAPAPRPAAAHFTERRQRALLV